MMATDHKLLTEIVQSDLAAPYEPVRTKRGVNLGCGTIILPTERPKHHQAIPEELYTDTTIAWDNVDRNAEPGVSMAVDLFTYPWGLPSNTYDVAIAAHIVEHVPHHITWNGRDWGGYTLANFSMGARELITQFGQIIPHHPLYQDGWFAWFSELWRILKPGGVAYVLCPYAWSHSGISDPTHTRYITLATFNYFGSNTNPESTFRYRMNQQWDYDLEASSWSPHELAMAEAQALTHLQTVLGGLAPTEDAVGARIFQMSHRSINALSDFCVTLTAVKDENHSQGRPASGSAIDAAETDGIA